MTATRRAEVRSPRAAYRRIANSFEEAIEAAWEALQVSPNLRVVIHSGVSGRRVRLDLQELRGEDEQTFKREMLRQGKYLLGAMWVSPAVGGPWLVDVSRLRRQVLIHRRDLERELRGLEGFQPDPERWPYLPTLRWKRDYAIEELYISGTQVEKPRDNEYDIAVPVEKLRFEETVRQVLSVTQREIWRKHIPGFIEIVVRVEESEGREAGGVERWIKPLWEMRIRGLALVLELMRIEPGDRVVEFGPGEGTLAILTALAGGAVEVYEHPDSIYLGPLEKNIAHFRPQIEEAGGSIQVFREDVTERRFLRRLVRSGPIDHWVAVDVFRPLPRRNLLAKVAPEDGIVSPQLVERVIRAVGPHVRKSIYLSHPDSVAPFTGLDLGPPKLFSLPGMERAFTQMKAYTNALVLNAFKATAFLFHSDPDFVSRLSRSEVRSEEEGRLEETLKRELLSGRWDDFESHFSGDADRILSVFRALGNVFKREDIPREVASEVVGRIANLAIPSAFPNRPDVHIALTELVVDIYRKYRTPEERQKLLDDIERRQQRTPIEQFEEIKDALLSLERLRDRPVSETDQRQWDDAQWELWDLTEENLFEQYFSQSFLTELFNFLWENYEHPDALSLALSLGLLNLIASSLGYSLDPEEITRFEKALETEDIPQVRVASAFFFRFPYPPAEELLKRIVEDREGLFDSEVHLLAASALQAMGADPAFLNRLHQVKDRLDFKLDDPSKPNPIAEAVLDRLGIGRERFEEFKWNYSLEFGIAPARRDEELVDAADIPLRNAAYLAHFARQATGRALSLPEARQMIFDIARSLPRAEVRASEAVVGSRWSAVQRAWRDFPLRFSADRVLNAIEGRSALNWWSAWSSYLIGRIRELERRGDRRVPVLELGGYWLNVARSLKRALPDENFPVTVVDVVDVPESVLEEAKALEIQYLQVPVESLGSMERLGETPRFIYGAFILEYVRNREKVLQDLKAISSPDAEFFFALHHPSSHERLKKSETAAVLKAEIHSRRLALQYLEGRLSEGGLWDRFSQLRKSLPDNRWGTKEELNRFYDQVTRRPRFLPLRLGHRMKIKRIRKESAEKRRLRRYYLDFVRVFRPLLGDSRKLFASEEEVRRFFEAQGFEILRLETQMEPDVLLIGTEETPPRVFSDRPKFYGVHLRKKGREEPARAEVRGENRKELTKGISGLGVLADVRARTTRTFQRGGREDSQKGPTFLRPGLLDSSRSSSSPPKGREGQDEIERTPAEENFPAKTTGTQERAQKKGRRDDIGAVHEKFLPNLELSRVEHPLRSSNKATRILSPTGEGVNKNIQLEFPESAYKKTAVSPQGQAALRVRAEVRARVEDEAVVQSYQVWRGYRFREVVFEPWKISAREQRRRGQEKVKFKHFVDLLLSWVPERFKEVQSFFGPDWAVVFPRGTAENKPSEIFKDARAFDFFQLYEIVAGEANLRANLMWRLREGQVLLRILRAHNPEELTKQELDWLIQDAKDPQGFQTWLSRWSPQLNPSAGIPLETIQRHEDSRAEVRSAKVLKTQPPVRPYRAGGVSIAQIPIDEGDKNLAQDSVLVNKGVQPSLAKDGRMIRLRGDSNPNPLLRQGSALSVELRSRSEKEGITEYNKSKEIFYKFRIPRAEVRSRRLSNLTHIEMKMILSDEEMAEIHRKKLGWGERAWTQTSGGITLDPGKHLPEFLREAKTKGSKVAFKDDLNGAKIIILGPGTKGVEILGFLRKFPGVSEIHLIDFNEPAFRWTDYHLNQFITREGPVQTKIYGYKTTVLEFPESLLTGEIDLVEDSSVFDINQFTEQAREIAEEQIKAALKPGGVHLTGGVDPLGHVKDFEEVWVPGSGESFEYRFYVKRDEPKEGSNRPEMRSELRNAAEPIVEAVVRGTVPARGEVRRFGVALREWPFEKVEGAIREVTKRLIQDPTQVLLGTAYAYALPQLPNSVAALIGQNPRAIFELLHKKYSRIEQLPQIDASQAIGIHSALVAEDPASRQEMEEKLLEILEAGGAVRIPFDDTLQLQKERRKILEASLRNQAGPATGNRVKAVRFVETLRYDDVLQGLGPEAREDGVLLLMADGSLVISNPKERKQALAFVIQPEVLGTLKLGQIFSLLQIIAAAPPELREFYRHELGLTADPETGLATVGQSFLESLARLAEMSEAVNIAA